MRLLISTFVFAALAAACGTATPSTEAEADQPLVSPTPSTTSAATPPTTSGSSSPSSPTTSATGGDLPPLDGPPAPDFSLELSDGSTFVLSEETRPVYLVFWAEW